METYRSLFETIIEFKNLHPWKWIGNMEAPGWVDYWINRDVLLTPAIMDVSPLLKSIQLLKTFPKNESAVWAIDMFFMPNPVSEGKKNTPFFPLVIVLVDLQSGIILSFRLTNYRDYKKEAQQLIIEALKNAKSIPSTIEMIRRELFFTLAPFKQPLGIELIHADHIPAIEYIKHEFIDKMSSPKGEIYNPPSKGSKIPLRKALKSPFEGG